MRFDRFDAFALGFGWGVLVAADGYRWLGLVALACSLIGAFGNARHDARQALVKDTRP